MEKSTKIILGVLLVGGVYWYWLKKKGTPISTVPNDKKTGSTSDDTNTPVRTIKKLYPADLKEGDYILIGSDPTVYLLKGGKKLPITYDWFQQYARDKWDSIIHIEPIVGMDIPVGDTLVL
jgi:hypothetical protein